jgi:choline dehydrogenase-like flavoprotein
VVKTKADIVIVGAGAAGSLYAALLAQAGKSVIMVDAGPAWTPGDLVSSQLWARRLKWGGAPVEFRGNHRGFGHNVNTGWGLGGAALHHYATWPRMHREAFATRRLYGRGADWPIGYDDLRPFYDRIQDEIGISGDAKSEIWRPEGAPYPLPPMQRFAQGTILAAGFEKLGHPVAPLPVGILSRDYKGRPACLNDGWCDAGCPIGSLANPLVTYQQNAREADVDIRARTTVTRILPDGPSRAAGVSYVDAQGKSGRIEAGTVILAASAVQNPRLLLASVCSEWPAGAGNAADQVGRNFMLDSLALVYGLFDAETEPHMGVSAGQITNRVRYAGDRPPGTPFGSYQWQIAPSMKPNDIFGMAITRADLFGPVLTAFITRASHHIASMVAMIGALPDPANRVVLSDKHDAFGVPLPRVEHRIDGATTALWEHCKKEGMAVMRAAGATETWTGPYNAGHLIGGTLMGGDPATSVTDSFGRVHGVENLVVAGSGLFPTSGGISPTYTLLAVAMRSAQELLR